MKTATFPLVLIAAILLGCANPGARRSDTYHDPYAAQRLSSAQVAARNASVSGVTAAPITTGSPAQPFRNYAPSTAIRRRSGGLYISPGDGHWIESVTGDGEIIKLEDGSVWQIDSLDTIDTALWLPVSDITVVESRGGYLLINTDDGEKAHATLLHQ